MEAVPNPTHRIPGLIPNSEPSRWPSVAPRAAIRTRPNRPIPRSISTTVVAIVFEPAAGAVSATRMTSPPMLLGRKLLKKVATRNDEVSFEKGSRMFWAFRSRPQRQALTRIMTK